MADAITSPTTASDSESRAALLRQHPLVLGLAVYLLLAILTFSMTPDDGFITLRIADNLLHHGQPVFNLGEKVEGYSSPLHLLVAAVVVIFPAGYVGLILKLVGLVFGALTLIPAVRLAKNVGLGPRGQLISTLLIALSWNLAASASNMLETSLGVLLLTSLLAALTSNSYRMAAVVSGLLVLERPESVLIVLFLAGSWLVLTRGEALSGRVKWMIAPAVVVAILYLHRILYFGELVPNTFYAKDISIGDGIFYGLEYLLHTQPWWGPMVLLAFPAAICELVFGIFAIVYWWRNDRRLLILPIVVLVQIACILRSGGDWMWGARHMAPIIPIMMIMTVVGARRVAQLYASRRARKHGDSEVGRLPSRPLVVIGIVALLALFAGPTQNTYNPIWSIGGVDNAGLIRDGGYGPYSSSWIKSAELTSCLPEGSSVAFSEVGYFGYENRRFRIIDTRGLTDRPIAKDSGRDIRLRTGVHDRHWMEPTSVVGSELLKRKPEVLLTLDVADPPATVLAGEYVLVNRMRVYGGSGSLPLSIYRHQGAAEYPCLTPESA